jgi:hypothetical protein
MRCHKGGEAFKVFWHENHAVMHFSRHADNIFLIHVTLQNDR